MIEGKQSVSLIQMQSSNGSHDNIPRTVPTASYLIAASRPYHHTLALSTTPDSLPWLLHAVHESQVECLSMNGRTDRRASGQRPSKTRSFAERIKAFKRTDVLPVDCLASQSQL